MSAYSVSREAASSAVAFAASQARKVALMPVGGIVRANLPKPETIKRYTVSIARPAPDAAKGKLWQKPGNRPANQIITDEEGARIRELARQGLTAPKIATQVDIHPASIRCWAVRNGVIISAARRSIITPEMHKRALQMQASGTPLSHAAASLGINSAVLQGWEKRNGLTFVRIFAGKEGGRKKAA